MVSYAAHLGTTDAASIYSLLQRAEIHTSDGISKVVSIIQNGKITAIPGDTAYFHIDREGDQLKLYVPRSKKHRQVCLARQLPITLLKHLGVRHPGKGVELGAIITASSLFAVDAILQEDGIIEVPGITRPEDDEEEDDTIASSEMSALESQAVTSPVRMPLAERRTEYFSATHHRPMVANASDDPLWTPTTSISFTSPRPPVRPELYTELLSSVIQQAGNIEGLPVVGASVVASVAADCHTYPKPAVSSNDFDEELFKIGAAGELFVSRFQPLEFLICLHMLTDFRYMRL